MRDEKLCQTLKLLRGALGAADLDGGLAVLDGFEWRALADVHDDEALELKWMGAECYDYGGQDGKATQILGSSGFYAKEALEQMMSARNARQEVQKSRHTYKQHVLVLLQWGFTFYRRGDYVKAGGYWQLCHRFVEKWLKAEDYPCYGTLARALYALGLIHRQLHRYPEARRVFSESIEAARRDAEWHVGLGGKDASALAHYRTAKCLALGSGWIAYTEGSGDLARPLIDAARMLLVGKKVRFISAYVDLVQACVQKAEYGDRLAQLREAIATLEKAYHVFDRRGRGHAAYKARAAHELALGYIRLAESCPAEKQQHLDAAQKFITQVREYATGKARGGMKTHAGKNVDQRWYCNALIAESRMWRLQGDKDKAQGCAAEALSQAESDPFATIDARIALGEALFELQEYLAATEQFTEALREGRANPKVEAVCHLHLARCYLGMRDLHKVRGHVERWRLLSTRVNNAFVRLLAKKVEEEMAGYKAPFLLEWPEEVSQMPYTEDLQKRLHGWLTEAAYQLAGPSGTAEQARQFIRRRPGAEPLGLAAFFLWRKDAGLPSTRRGGAKRSSISQPVEGSGQ